MSPRARSRRRIVAAAIAGAIALARGAPARADASSDGDPPTSSAGRSLRLGAYGAPEVKLTTLGTDVALLLGGRAGVVLDRHVVVGAAGYGLASTHTPDVRLRAPVGESRLELGYGGLRAGYVFAPTEVVHVTVAALIGGGGVAIATKDATQGSGFQVGRSALFIALEPQAEVEINVSLNVRLALGTSYRYLGDTVLPGLRASDLSGLAGYLAVEIGFF